MSKGFGFGHLNLKVKAKKNDSEASSSHRASQLIVESMVKASNLEPAVVLKWGSYEGIMTPDEAIAHAMDILEKASAARSDSAVTKLFSSLEGLDIPKAALFRRLLRDFRNEERGRDMSNVRVVLNPDEEPVPVPELKGYAGFLLHTAVMTETEAFLIEYLRQKLEMDEERINQIIGELRGIMFPEVQENK